MSSFDRRVGTPPRTSSRPLDVRRCSIRSRRAAGAFGKGSEWEPAARRGRPALLGH